MTKVCIYSPINILLQVHPIQSRKFPSPSATERESVILYIGIGLVAVGLVITFVGLGEKGFKSMELKMVGPSLVTCGVFCVFLQILYCTLPLCAQGYNKKEDDEKLLQKEEIFSQLQLNHQDRRRGSDKDNHEQVFVKHDHSDKSFSHSKKSQRTILKAARLNLPSSELESVFFQNVSVLQHQDSFYLGENEIIPIK